MRSNSQFPWWDLQCEPLSASFNQSMHSVAILRWWHGKESVLWFTSGLCVSCIRCRLMRADISFMNIQREPDHGRKNVWNTYGGNPQWREL